MRTILISNKPFSVRKNLYNFLSMIQHDATNDDIFWIDHLCIDQNSVTERNHQVRLMAIIYSQAEAVYAWLGEADKDAAAGFRILHELEESENHVGESGQFVSGRKVNDMLSRYPVDDLRSLMKLFKNSYWTRVWIVQEVFLANELLLLCGPYVQRVNTANRWNHTLRIGTHTELSALAAVWQDDQADQGITKEDRQVIRDALRLLGRRSARKTSFTTGTQPSWMHPDDTILSPTRRHCTNPLDQIYGFQACLAPDRRVAIDYNKSAEDLLLEQIIGPCRFLADIQIVGQRLGLVGALPGKCFTLEKIRRVFGRKGVVDVVRSSGIDLMSEDPQHELCERIFEEFKGQSVANHDFPMVQDGE